MADVDNSMSGIMWQWLAEHKQDILDYFSTIMREASEIQLVNYDSDRHAGILASYIYQGIRRIDNVKPTTLVEGLSQLGAAVRERCDNAAANAETQARYAQQQGDRVDNAIAGFQALSERVTQQGNTAEQQGANAQSIRDSINLWYNGQNNNGFKKTAENLYSQFEGFYSQAQTDWNNFYTEGAVPDWNTFWAAVLLNWQQWTEEEASRKGILCLDFDYDEENGDLVMDYVERDTLTTEMFDYEDGDMIIDYNIN